MIKREEYMIGNPQNSLKTLLSEDREQIRKFIQVVELIHEAVIITDTDRRVIYVNPATEKMLGYDAAEMVGEPSARFFEGVPGNPSRLADRIREESAPLVGWAGEVYDRHKTGRVFPVKLRLAPIRNGEIIGYVGISSDLSLEKKLSEELRRLRKMKSIGILASGLTHDFNNYLQVILGGVEVLKRELPPRHSGASSLELIERSARNASRIARHLLTFSRPGKIKPEEVDIPGVVEETISLLERYRPAEITIRREGTAEVPGVTGFSIQLEQVFLNLGINAVEMLERGGEIIYRVGREKLSARLRSAHPGLPPGEFVTVQVSDQGPGIPAEKLEKIFEPFFTTREKDGKTGLGLTVSASIIRSHHGFITVESTPGRGSAFKVYLPGGKKASARRQ